MRGGTTRPSITVLSKAIPLSPPAILRKDRTRPIAIITVVYEALILSLRMAPTKDRAMISDNTVNGEPAPKSVNANPALGISQCYVLRRYFDLVTEHATESNPLPQCDLGRFAGGDRA